MLDSPFFPSYPKFTVVIKRHQKWSPAGDRKAKLYKELDKNSNQMYGAGKNFDLVENKKFTDAVISDSRIKILKNLAKRKMTAAELTRQIGIEKNAIYKHLDKLLDAQIVRRIENNERKWVYYELTEKGIAIVSAKRLQIFVLISSGVGTALLGAFLVARYYLRLAEIAGKEKAKGIELISDFDLGLILIFISIILLLITWFVSRNKWKRVAENIQAPGD